MHRFKNLLQSIEFHTLLLSKEENRFMKKIILFLTVLFGLFTVSCSVAPKTVKPAATKAETFNLKQKLPQDPNVITGKLKNGLTYYIRQNHKPEDRLTLRLVVNAGSILEDNDQQGLAHLCEHMAFNGTKHFHKQALVNYLESIGMRFGADLNAYTGFDETVYKLQVPTDSAKIVEKAFQILEDWAHWVTYNDKEIDKEKGVVIEEWRLGRGARMRMLNEELPVLLKDSRYAVRLPIGQKAVLDTFKHNTLRRFYKTWYRPDLMAVIAVGDMDPQRIKQLIRQHFSSIANPQKEQPRKLYPVPDHPTTLYSIASDKEANRSSISLYYLLPTEKEKTFNDYRQQIVEALFSGMFNARFSELAQKKDPPFVYAYSYKGNLVRTKDAYILGAMTKDNGIPRALKAILTEAKRVKDFGFTSTELQRQKKALLRGMEKSYAERNKTRSVNYVSEYQRNFLQGEPFPGIKIEYEMYKQFLPGISLQEVNGLIAKWMKDKSRVVVAESPQKKGVIIPTKSELAALVNTVDTQKLTAYKDKVLNAPLLAHKPTPSPVIKQKILKKIGVTEWTLKNGVKVVLKPTDFKNDEVRFTSFSPGGYSLADNSDLIPAKTAAGIVNSSGFGKFNRIQLRKALAGKIAMASPSISRLTESVAGAASPKDLEIMFQLIYLSFTAPREDSTAFLSYKSKMKAYYENKGASPEDVFQDSVMAVFTQHDPRFKPFDLAAIKKLDLQKSLQIYRDRFADAGDFTFFFVGNFTPEKIKPLVETYLGGLPVIKRKESWQDHSYNYPKGVVEKVVKKGMEPKSRNVFIFSGPFEWNRKNEALLNTMAGVLSIKLRERLREDKSGTYGVSVHARAHHYPRERYTVSISFGCNPKRVAELSKEMFAQIDSLQHFPPAVSYLKKRQEISARALETNLKRNAFWLNYLKSSLFNHTNPLEVGKTNEIIQNLTMADIQKAAQKYLNTKNYVHLVLYPEK